MYKSKKVISRGPGGKGEFRYSKDGRMQMVVKEFSNLVEEAVQEHRKRIQNSVEKKVALKNPDEVEVITKNVKKKTAPKVARQVVDDSSQESSFSQTEQTKFDFVASQQKIETLEKRAKNLEKDKKELGDNIITKNNEIRKLQNSLKKKGEEVDALEQKKEHYKTLYAKAQEDLEKLQAGSANESEKIKNLEDDVKKYRDKNRELQDRLDKLQTENQTQSDEFKNLKKKKKIREIVCRCSRPNRFPRRPAKNRTKNF